VKFCNVVISMNGTQFVKMNMINWKQNEDKWYTFDCGNASCGKRGSFHG
jgi:hypothetical protein